MSYDWHKEILRLLYELGHTEREVRNTLVDKKIKGKRSSACACPIAMYLRGCDGNGTMLRVHSYGVETEHGRFLVSLPDHVKSFIMDFDRGHYPELDVEAA